MNLFVYYRISDKGRPKEKLSNGDRYSCLQNAVREFGADSIHVIADNCETKTVDFIRSFTEQGLIFEETSLGNAGSFVHMLDLIIKTHKKDDYVYLLEDDYLHLPGSKQVMLEGLEIADYVTLYDHPDKYKLNRDGGNPFNHKKLQKTRLYVTTSTHWRECNSTPMTFSCKVNMLIEDYKLWKKYTVGAVIPNSFFTFSLLTRQKDFSDIVSFFLRRRLRMLLILLRNVFTLRKTRKLISAVPALSTHAELLYLSPKIDWEKVV